MTLTIDTVYARQDATFYLLRGHQGEILVSVNREGRMSAVVRPGFVGDPEAQVYEAFEAVAERRRQPS